MIKEESRYSKREK